MSGFLTRGVYRGPYLSLEGLELFVAVDFAHRIVGEPRPVRPAPTPSQSSGSCGRSWTAPTPSTSHAARPRHRTPSRLAYRAPNRHGSRQDRGSRRSGPE
jgi:hypothetical protein